MTEKSSFSDSAEKLALNVSLTSLILNLLLSIFKLSAGITGHSQAMISDAVHSASDCASTVVVMIGVHCGHRQADANHPFGHERLESAASLILAVMLGITGVGVGISAIRTLCHPADLQVPGRAALMMAVVSILVKEGQYWWTRWAALTVDSDALMADAWHHRSDALSSLGALLGIGGARKGWLWMDPAVGLIICALILAVAVKLFWQSLNKMIDQSCDTQALHAIAEVIVRQPGVMTIDTLRTRIFGNRIYVELEIGVDAHLPLVEAHAIAENVHQAVEETFPRVKHCAIHVNPVRKE